MELRQLGELIAETEKLNTGRNGLLLDPSVEIPDYQRAVGILKNISSYLSSDFRAVA